MPEVGEESREFLVYLFSQMFPKYVTVLLSILTMPENFEESAERSNF